MTVQIEATKNLLSPGRWHSIRKWLTAIDEGFNYDPNKYTYDMIRVLTREINQLEAKVTELESTRRTK